MASAKRKPAVRKAPPRKTLSGPAEVIVLPAPPRSLPEIQPEFQRKDPIDRVHLLLTRLEDQAAHHGRAIARLQKRKAITLGRVERVTDKVLQRMEREALQTVEGWKASLERRQAPPSVEIVDEALLPKEYVRVKELTSPDKHAIREAITNRDVDVPGARLFQRFMLLRREL